MSKKDQPLDDFSGQARLFPLPNLVLFPKVRQPLHIFEPRYRQMLADALTSDRLIAMALLCPGWEADYRGNPPIHSVVCLGQIKEQQRFPDGRYNLVLEGLRRARILEEVKTDRLYRIAHVELLEDKPVRSPKREKALREQFVDKLMPYFADNPKESERVSQLLHSDLPLGLLCDLFSSVLPAAIEVKQQLLEELRVEERVRLLVDTLTSLVSPDPQSEPTDRSFPPEFSSN